MARPDDSGVAKYKEMYGIRNRFDIVLAVAFEPEEKGDIRFVFYDALGERIRRLGKTIYLPHREIDLGWPCEKIYDIVNEIVIPTSDLVLCYAGLPSTATGIMAGSAIKHRVPVIYFYERGRENNFDSNKLFRADVQDLIEFDNDEEALEKIEASVRAFYKK